MDTNRQESPRKPFSRTLLFVGVGLLGAVALLCFLLCPRKPPDLTACTRVDVHYKYGALDYFFGFTPMLDRVLGEGEQQFVRSFDKWTVTDPEKTRAFADQIRRGKDRGIVTSKILAIPTDITCCRGRRRVASFSVYHPTMATVHAKGHRFSYPPGLSILSNLDPPALKPLTARWECAKTLDRLWPGPEQPPYPDPNEWCDVIVAAMRRMHTTDYTRDGKARRSYPDRVIAREFTCPAVHPSTDASSIHSPPDETDPSVPPPDSWLSDYAMNSNCREGSPDDMVLLFESPPGWNQHGGPELFTFDNHDPRGGSVLLHDGTVKFIRTAEELQQLRWK